MHRGCWTSTSSTSTRLILSRMTHSPTVTLAAKQMMSMTLYVNELQMCACTWSTSGPMMCSADVLCCRSRSWVNSRRHSAQMVCRHQTSFCASSKTTMTLSCAILSEATQGRNWVSALSRWTCVITHMHFQAVIMSRCTDSISPVQLSLVQEKQIRGKQAMKQLSDRMRDQRVQVADRVRKHVSAARILPKVVRKHRLQSASLSAPLSHLLKC